MAGRTKTGVWKYVGAEPTRRLTPPHHPPAQPPNLCLTLSGLPNLMFDLRGDVDVFLKKRKVPLAEYSGYKERRKLLLQKMKVRRAIIPRRGTPRFCTNDQEHQNTHRVLRNKMRCRAGLHRVLRRSRRKMPEPGGRGSAAGGRGLGAGRKAGAGRPLALELGAGSWRPAAGAGGWGAWRRAPGPVIYISLSP